MKKSNVFSNKINTIRNSIFSHRFASNFLIIIYTVWLLLITFTPYIDNGIAFELADLLDLEDSLIYFSACEIETENLVIFPFLICLINFSFLHNKSLCYTTLSFATKRKTIFATRFFVPVAIMILITFIIKLITLKLNYNIYGFESSLSEAFWVHMLTLIKVILFGSFCAILPSLLCRRTIEATASGVSLLFLPTVLCVVSRFINELTLYGASFYSESILTKIFDALNPLDFNEEHYGIYFCNEDIPPLLKDISISGVWILALCIAFCLLELYFSRRYKPEYCGTKGHSAIFSAIVSCTLPLIALGLFFEDFLLYNSDFDSPSFLLKSFLIGFVVMAICALICNAVTFFSKRHIKFALMGIVISLVTFGTLAGINASDIFNTYNKLPQKDDIQGITLSIPYKDFFSSYSHDATVFNYYLTEPNATTLFHTNEEKEAILELHNTIINNRNKDTNIRAEFTYTLKNGDIVSREYSFLSNEAVNKIASLRTGKAGETCLKEMLLPETCTFDSSSTVKVNTQKSGLILSTKLGKMKVINNMTMSDDQFFRLRNAILKDLISIPNDKWYYQNCDFLGTLDIFINIYPTDDIEIDQTIAFSTHIFPSMENTINLLKELDYYKFFFNDATIKEAYIGNLDDIAYNISQSHITGPVFSTQGALDFIKEIPDVDLEKITDKKKINTLMEKAHPYYLLGNNKQGKLLLIVVEYENTTKLRTFYITD